MNKSRYIWFPAACLMLASCADDYKETIPMPEKPADVVLSERLASYDVLSKYSSEAGVKLGVNVNPATFAEKGMLYGIVKTNFDQVEAYGQIYPSGVLDQESGVYDLSAVSSLVETAREAGVSVFGPSLVSLSNIPRAYYRNLIADVVIPYQPWQEKTDMIDFENESDGTAYPSQKKKAGTVDVAIATDPVQGKVLKGTKLTMDIPMIPVIKLPEGATLGDVTRVSLKCYLEDGKPTSSRLQIENAGVNEKGNPYNEKGSWQEYVFDVTQIKFTDAQKALTEFSLCAGAYGSAVTCMIDDVVLTIDHLTGDPTIIPKTEEEKTEIIGGELNKWVDGITAIAAEDAVDFVIYDEPLSDDDATFFWADFLGDRYVADVQKRVDAAMTQAPKYFVSQTISMGNGAELDLDDLMNRVAALEAKGVKVDGVNLVLFSNYSCDYVAQLNNDRNLEKFMNRLASINKLVRIGNFAVQVFDADGTLVSPSKLTVLERQAVGEYYEKALSLYLSNTGSRAYGFSLSDVTDGDIYTAPWNAGGNRNFIYESLVRGLQPSK